MSAGSRSLVNWMRWNDSERERASACASVVFPTPGTSSRRMCPLASMAAMQNCAGSLLPRITVSTFAWSEAIWWVVRGRVIGWLVISLTYTGNKRKTCRVQQGGLPIHSPAIRCDPYAGLSRIVHLSRHRARDSAHAGTRWSLHRRTDARPGTPGGTGLGARHLDRHALPHRRRYVRPLGDPGPLR